MGFNRRIQQRVTEAEALKSWERKCEAMDLGWLADCRCEGREQKAAQGGEGEYTGNTKEWVDKKH